MQSKDFAVRQHSIIYSHEHLGIAREIILTKNAFSLQIRRKMNILQTEVSAEDRLFIDSVLKFFYRHR